MLTFKIEKNKSKSLKYKKENCKTFNWNWGKESKNRISLM